MGPGRSEHDPAKDGLSPLILSWRRWLTTGTFTFGPALLIGSPWLWRNWRLYGDPLGMTLVRQTVDQRMSPWTWTDTVWLFKGWFLSFWGKFGGAGHIPMPMWIYGALGGLTLISMIGLLRLWLRPAARAQRPVIAFFCLACVTVAIGIWRYSLVALGTDQGRLLFPAVGPMAALFVMGLWAWLPAAEKPPDSPAARRDLLHKASPTALGGGLLILLMMILGMYGLFGVIRGAFAPPPAVPAGAVAKLPAASPIVFGDLELIGWQAGADPTLYWQAVRPPTADWRTILRVVTADGKPVWEWRRSPGYGRWSTGHWQPGAVYRDEYMIPWPDWATSGRYAIEVGLQPYGRDLVMPIRHGVPVAAPDHRYAQIMWLER